MVRGACVAAVLVVAGCSHRKPAEPAAPPAAPPAAQPVPPAGAAPGLTLPDPDAATINAGLSSEEALWHVRSALNVAALGCGASGGAIVANYNRLLTERKAPLATAYGAVKAKFGANPATLDTHMTQLYNFFAQPPAQRGFCPVADQIAARFVAAPGDELAAMAPAALAELEAPVRDYYRAYATYRRDLAAWQKNRTTVAAAATAPAPVPETVAISAAAVAPASAWRIQIGAFTGQAAAEAAWRTAQRRAPSLAAYQPVYEKVEGSPLVRLQVGAASDRDGALRLCATAAAGGFDCMPRKR